MGNQRTSSGQAQAFHCDESRPQQRRGKEARSKTNGHKQHNHPTYRHEPHSQETQPVHKHTGRRPSAAWRAPLTGTRCRVPWRAGLSDSGPDLTVHHHDDPSQRAAGLPHASPLLALHIVLRVCRRHLVKHELCQADVTECSTQTAGTSSIQFQTKLLLPRMLRSNISGRNEAVKKNKNHLQSSDTHVANAGVEPCA
eukprot:jgi/Ulvmu1/7401/UM036_0061.1